MGSADENKYHWSNFFCQKLKSQASFIQLKLILDISLRGLSYSSIEENNIYVLFEVWNDRLCGLQVRVLGYRSGGPGSIPDTTRKKQ
jgi:hypothetical protein